MRGTEQMMGAARCESARLYTTLHQACSEDLPSLTFWLFNSTILLHLLRSDQDVSNVMEHLALFGLLEELINAIFGLCSENSERFMTD